MTIAVILIACAVGVGTLGASLLLRAGWQSRVPMPGIVTYLAAGPVTYCVAGRHPTVILSTGALGVLDPAELRAVVAHERAHLSGRHHRLLALALGRVV